MVDTNAIDWSRYPDGLGDTAVVPALLDELAAGPKKARAHAITVELGEERLVHQMTVAAAAAPAVPCLVALLAAPEPTQKEDLLLVLARIAAGGDPEGAWHGRAHEGVHGEAGPAGAAVIGARAVITALLEHKRSMVRAAAALVLALLPPHESSVTAVAARWQREKDDKARGALLTCLSAWQRTWGHAVDPALVASRESKPFAELCRAAARAWSPALRDDADRHVLAAAVLDPPKGFDATRDLPLSSRRLAFEALRAAFPASAREAGLAALRSGHLAAWEVLPLGMTVPPPQSLWADIPLPGELAPEERSFLRAVVEALPASKTSSWLPWTMAKATGLPQGRGDVRRWLGLDAPGPMEIVVSGWPAYRWYRRVATGRVTREAFAQALRAHPAAEEVLAIALASCAGHLYDLFYVGAWSWTDAVHLACDVLGGRPDAESALRATLPLVKHGWEPLVVLASLTRIVAARGEVVPESADACIAQACTEHPPLVPLVREVVQALPPPRRHALVMALPLPASVPVRATVWSVQTTGRPVGWAFLDLAADRTAAARRAAAAIAAWPPPASERERLPEEEALFALAALEEAAPLAIDEALPKATGAGRAVLERARLRLSPA